MLLQSYSNSCISHSIQKLCMCPSLLQFTSIFTIVGLEINFEESTYFITEADTSDPHIRLQFRRTQNPFTIFLFSVNIVDMNQAINIEDYVYVYSEANSATAGECMLNIARKNVQFPRSVLETSLMHGSCCFSSSLILHLGLHVHNYQM